MELTFNKVGDFYVAEFQATGPFALHLEIPADKLGHLRVRQTSVEGGAYALIDDMPMSDENRAVVDRQFVGELWPLWIQVEVGATPTLAVVTFNA
jgi:hypothetical protein